MIRSTNLADFPKANQWCTIQKAAYQTFIEKQQKQLLAVIKLERKSLLASAISGDAPVEHAKSSKIAL